MKKHFIIVAISFFLSACGGAQEKEAPKVSRMEPAAGAGMSYHDFRDHHINEGDNWAAQKRFLILDRNNDGKLSPSEFNGY
jgi:hypothetical protein